MSAAGWPALLAAQLALFLAPGLVGAAWLHQRSGLHERYVLPVASLAGCLVGYAAFWIYWASAPAGRVFSVALAVVEALAALALAARPWLRAVILRLDVLAPLVLVLVVSIFYIGDLVSCVRGVCLTTGYPIDTSIPAIFAYHLADGERHATLGEWHFSDRPPLQAGIVLAQGVLTLNPAIMNPAYQALGTILQCLWVVALWAVLRRLGLPPRLAAPAMAFAVFLGFFLFNSVFLWPKLLAAACGALGVLLLFAERPRPLHWSLGAAALACALLAHTGVVFTLIPLAGGLLLRRYRPPWRLLALGAAVLAPPMLAWSAYQRFIDPPGDRLLKWHLAGVIPVDDRTFGQALADQYGSLTLGAALDNRWHNLLTMVSFGLDDLRMREFYGVFPALGLLNLGWLLLAVPWVRRGLRQRYDTRLLGLLLGGALAALVVWCLMMFGPGFTLLHAGSYLTELMLVAGLVTVLSVLPRPAVLGLLAAHVAVFASVWVAGVYRTGEISRWGTALMLAGLAGVVAALVVIGRSGDDAPPVTPRPRDVAAPPMPTRKGTFLTF